MHSPLRLKCVIMMMCLAHSVGCGGPATDRAVLAPSDTAASTTEPDPEPVAAEQVGQNAPSEPATKSSQPAEPSSPTAATGEASKSDPYMLKLAADVYSEWEIPSLEKGPWTVQACVRVAPTGKITDTKLQTRSKNTNIDRSVELALKKAKEKRDKRDEPVPEHMMSITTHWLCFRFSV